MGWAILADFDTEQEAVDYLNRVASKEFPKHRLCIFDDKDYAKLTGSKRFTVNVD